MYKEASRYKQETLHSPITEIHLGCPREVIQGMKRRHGVGVVMENLLDSGSIQFYFEDFISIQASRCSWGNCSLIRIEQNSPGLLSSVHLLPPCFDSLACGETQRYENNPTFPHSIEVMIYNRAQHLVDSRAPRNSATLTCFIFGAAS